jgi:hypothetical protein
VSKLERPAVDPVAPSARHRRAGPHLRRRGGRAAIPAAIIAAVKVEMDLSSVASLAVLRAEDLCGTPAHVLLGLRRLFC